MPRMGVPRMPTRRAAWSSVPSPTEHQAQVRHRTRSAQIRVQVQPGGVQAGLGPGFGHRRLARHDPAPVEEGGQGRPQGGTQVRGFDLGHEDQSLGHATTLTLSFLHGFHPGILLLSHAPLARPGAVGLRGPHGRRRHHPGGVLVRALAGRGQLPHAVRPARAQDHHQGAGPRWQCHRDLRGGTPGGDPLRRYPQGLRERAGGHGGLGFLEPQRRLGPGPHALRMEFRHQLRPSPGGCLDAHHAAHPHRHSEAPEAPGPQAEGDHPGAQAGEGLLQEADHGDVRQRGLLRRRTLWHRGRSGVLLREERPPAQRGGVRPAGGAGPESRTGTTPTIRTPRPGQRPNPGATTCCCAW